MAYPNPASEKLTIEVDSYGNQTLLLNLISLNGTIVRQLSLTGQSRVSFDLNGLENGLYLLQLTGNDGSVSKRIIISG